MTAMSVDTDTLGNSATGVGAIEPCVEALAGSQVTFDITAQDIPPFFNQGDADPANDSGGMTGYSFNLDYDPAAMSVTAKTIMMLSATAGSNLFDAGEPLPDTDGVYQAGAVDLSTTTPESGAGVLERITVDIAAGAATGQYNLNLTSPAHLDGSGAAYIPDTTNIGAIAVGQVCGAIVTPSPTPTNPPTPTPPPVTDTPTPSPTPVPTPTPVGQTPTPVGQTPTPVGQTPTPVPGAGTATPARTPTPAALPPTGTTDGGTNAAVPIALGGAGILVIAMALGGYEITRRLRRDA
jgi:hypothetical protein